MLKTKRFYYTMCASIKQFSLFVLYKIHTINHAQLELQHLTALILNFSSFFKLIKFKYAKGVLWKVERMICV